MREEISEQEFRKQVIEQLSEIKNLMKSIGICIVSIVFGVFFIMMSVIAIANFLT